MMKLVFVLVSSYLVIASGRRIIGGTDTSIQQIPYQVALELYGQHCCGGSILSQTKILTAAHCISDHAHAYKVRAGSSFRHRGGQLIQVARIHVHPRYRSDIYHNDIAVLILAQPLRFDQNVQPIQLSGATGQYAYASGWGLNGFGIYPDHLQMVKLSNLSDMCPSVFGYYYDQNIMVCYGDINNKRNVCSGDSGGPLTINGKQVGVASFVSGEGCSNPHIAAFAKVSVFINFINSSN